MNILKGISPQAWRSVLWTLAVGIVLLGVFQMGVFVGYHRASFSYRWGENYHRMFGGPRMFGDARRGFFREFDQRDYTDAHGIFGTLLKIEGNTLIMKDKDDTEKTIVFTTSTVVRAGRDTIQPSALSINQNIVVIGTPNDKGQVEAKLIRVFPQR